MLDPLPIVLVPGLNCSARLYANQIYRVPAPNRIFSKFWPRDAE